ncbi:MAG TPA: GDSL-type esterase/lipase family protein [Chitinophagaceae bacterium]|nr:GDSL-type esterase/lipase family protein [Chitinophagaceae bacterium]
MIWYEEEVKRIEKERNTLKYEPKTIFYGSSSIRLWKTLYEDFKEYYPVNLGFGGSTLAACVWFFERVLKPYQPEHLIVYAGDNDLGDGRNPEEVYIFFQQFLAYMHRFFPGVLFTYISIKPSISRRNLKGKICYTNQLIQQLIEESGEGHYFLNVYDKMIDAAGNPVPGLYDADGLHLSSKGYEIWKQAVLTHISLNVESSLTRL